MAAQQKLGLWTNGYRWSLIDCVTGVITDRSNLTGILQI